MDYLLVGEVIREERRRRGLTQEDLSDGICSVSSLSKIENGRQMPHHATITALLERLGTSVGFHCYIEVKEAEQWRILWELEENLWLYNGQEIRERFRRLDDCRRWKNRMQEQWYLTIEQLLFFLEKREPEEILKRLTQVTRMSISEFDGAWLENRCLMRCELVDFYLYALCLGKMQQYGEASELLWYLADYTRKNGYDWWMRVLRERARFYFSCFQYLSPKEEETLWRLKKNIDAP